VTVTDAVIPVAGLGTRLLPATRSQPKEMLPLVDKPVVQLVLEELMRAGIRRVLFVTGRRKRAIEDHFDAAPELELPPLLDGLQIFYTRQADPAGLGDALRYGEDFADGREVAVALGDAVIDPPPAGPGIVRRLSEAFRVNDAVAAIAVTEVAPERVSRYGITVLGDELPAGAFDVRKVIEKPDQGRTPSRIAVMGRYVLGPAVFRALRSTPPGVGGEVQLADALRRAQSAGGRIIAVPLGLSERRYDIGSAESYCSAFIDHALRDPRFGASLRRHAAQLLDDAD
jgi:UTP--glucose-1-phosphate uridylyltransferase